MSKNTKRFVLLKQKQRRSVFFKKLRWSRSQILFLRDYDYKGDSCGRKKGIGTRPKIKTRINLEKVLFLEGVCLFVL